MMHDTACYSATLEASAGENEDKLDRASDDLILRVGVEHMPPGRHMRRAQLSDVASCGPYMQHGCAITIVRYVQAVGYGGDGD